jgi:DNA-binding CsgD family transcriptional regulator
MDAAVRTRSESRYSVPSEIRVLASQSDGRVTGQSRAARELLGSANDRACWSLMQNVPGARRLPCTRGCVRALLSNSRAVSSHSIDLRGQTFDMRCEPVGDRIVTTLRARLTGPEERVGPTSPKGPVTEQARLTPREMEVLRLLAEGLDGSEIAESLGIRAGTVRTHVEHMRASLHCRTRAGLVAKGYQLRYLP